MSGLERIFNDYNKTIMNKSKKWINIKIQPQIKLECFYEIMKKYFSSPQSKKITKEINKWLEEFIKDQENLKKVEKDIKKDDKKRYSLEDIRDFYV